MVADLSLDPEKFCTINIEPACQDKEKRGLQHHGEMPALLYFPFLFSQPGQQDCFSFDEHSKTGPAKDNKENNGQVDQPIALIADQTVRVQGKTRITEGGNGVKQGGERRESFRIGKKEQQGTEELDNKGYGHDLDKKSTQMKPGIMEQALAHRNSVGQGDPLFPEEKGQTGKGHNAQAAHLDKQENYRLTSTGEFLAGISHYQTGNTGRRGGGEQGIQPGYGRAVAAKGTVQKTCSDNDCS